VTEITLREYRELISDRIEQGRYAEAIAHGKHILTQYPKHAATYRLLGEALLEAGQDEYASDMFRRVLSADTEDLTAWVGMSEIHNHRGELDAAVWYMERAFELASNNPVVEDQLRQLYGRRDGVEPERAQLTRGALARLYLKGDLLSRAISELRALVDEHPERVDLSLALAEALWRNEQRLEASEVCQQVLDKLPYCLKANLLMGEIWSSRGHAEAETYLQRAREVDPEGLVAKELLGSASPLPVSQVGVSLLEYRPPAEEELPEWMAELEASSIEAPLGEQAAVLADLTAGLEAQIEIPPWLEEISVGGEGGEVAAAEPAEEEVIEEAPIPLEEAPEWLSEPGEGFTGEEIEVGEEEEPQEEWVTGLGVELAEEEQVSEWLAELPGAPSEEEVPDWLTQLEEVKGATEEAAPVAEAEEVPDWLAALREEVAEAEEEAGAIEEAGVPAAVWPESGEEAPGEEVLTWLDQLSEGEEGPGEEALAQAESRLAEVLEGTEFGVPEAPSEATLAVEEAVAEEEAAEGAAVPAWLEGEEMPSGDEALAWLEKLTEGREEELRAQAEAEGEARMAEIMGRPAGEEPSVPPVEEAVPEEAEAEVEEVFGWTAFEAVEEEAEEAVPEGAEAEVEEAFGWTAFEPPKGPAAEVVEEEGFPERLEAVEEAAAEEEVAEEAAVPAWLEAEELPSGDEALAWLEQLAEGREEELRAQAEAEGEARMAEIMGRPAGEEPSVPPVEEAVPEEAEAEVEEVFGWTAFEMVEEPAPEEVEAEVAEIAAEAGEVPVPPVEETLVPPVGEAPSVVEEAAAEVEGVPVAEVAEEAPGAPEAVEEEGAPTIVAEPAEVSAEPFAAERAHLRQHPRDYEAWLALARALWQAGEREEALDAYSRVIRTSKLLESAVADLEEYVKQWPDVTAKQVLGDAYMKSGRLQEALALYREALEEL